MLLLLVVSLCVTTVVIGQHPPSCHCTTDTWQGIFHLPAGFYVQSLDLAGFSDIHVYVFYDYTQNKMAAVRHISAPDAQFEIRNKLIWNWNQGLMRRYSINPDGTCTYRSLTGSMERICIPSDSVYHQHRYFGGPQHKLETDEWIFPGTLQFNVTVTRGDCAPFLIRAFGNLHEGGVDVTLVGEGHFLNITHTIHDDKVFDPPADCQPGKEQSLEPPLLKHFLKATMGLE